MHSPAMARWFTAVATVAAVFGATTRGRDVASAPPRPSGGPIEHRLTGTIGSGDYERIFERAFDVPHGTRRIEVAYEASGAAERTVVDLGLRGPAGLRGWSGGSRSRIWVSRLGAAPGYLPGPIEPGTWAVILGVANIRAGRADTYTVTVRLHDDDLAEGATLEGRGEGWYVGDLHAHSGHSDGRSRSRRGHAIGTPVHRILDAAAAAGLDFVALSDHNTAAHWLDLDRLQPHYDDLLLLRGREITTYRGHANTVGERAASDFRLPTPATSPAAVLAAIAGAGAFVSINHPAAPDDERCMGCGWNDTDDATLAAVHGVEIVNGDAATGPLAGWRFWADLLNRGHRLVAVGGSDEHTVDDPDDRMIGRPATVIRARTLSEAALVEGLKSGRVHVRTRGPRGPAVDLRAEHDGGVTWMGGITAAVPRRLVAGIGDAAGQTVEWIADGEVVARAAVAGAMVTLDHPPAARWYAVVVRDDRGPTAFSNAIHVRR